MFPYFASLEIDWVREAVREEIELQTRLDENGTLQKGVMQKKRERGKETRV